MELQSQISKMALDKESVMLGKIARIDRLPHLLTKKILPHIIIQVKIGFRKKVSVPIDSSKIIKINNENVWLNITKEEFERELDKQIQLFQERRMYKGFVNPYGKWFVSGTTDLRPRSKRRNK